MRTIFAALILLGFLLVVFFAMWPIFSMAVGPGGVMSNCIFDREGISLCYMNVVEHITLWQNVFLAVIFIFSFTAVFIFSAISKYLFDKFAQARICQKEYLDIFLFDYLRRAFSQGILNPKVF